MNSNFYIYTNYTVLEASQSQQLMCSSSTVIEAIETGWGDFMVC